MKRPIHQMEFGTIHLINTTIHERAYTAAGRPRLHEPHRGRRRPAGRRGADERRGRPR